MLRYPASAARHIFISGPGTIAKYRPDKFGIRPILGRFLGRSIPTWVPGPVLLATALVNVVTAGGKAFVIRALLDQGS